MGSDRQVAWALALDGHGVVYRRNQEVVDAVIKALANQGLIFSHEEARALYLSLQERTFTGELSYPGMVNELHHRLRLAPRLSPGSLDHLIQKFSAAIHVDPELPDVLRELRTRGVRIGMITNSIHPAPVKQHWLRQAGIAELFDLILSSAEEHCKKPAPEIFARFAARMNVPPHGVAFLGHDPEEIAGARKAGFLTIALACPNAHADFHIRRIGELQALPIWPGQKEGR